MNIIVDLNYPIKDGTEVVFRSPVDCSQVKGLLVNYQDNGPCTKEFALADANGNNVGKISHLFGEDVPVKVILDVTKKSMAFVQNADTNAYLEGRFAELEDKIGTGGGSTDSAVLYTEQDLTPEQQAQARENIGAISEVANESITPEKTTFVQVERTPVSINLFDKDTMAIEGHWYYEQEVGKTAPNPRAAAEYGAITIPVKGLLSVTLSYDKPNSALYLYNYFFVDDGGIVISAETLGWKSFKTNDFTLAVPSGAVSLFASINGYSNTTSSANRKELMAVAGNTAMPYQPYSDDAVEKIYIPNLVVENKEMRLCLPAKYDLVVGDTFELFYKGIMLCKDPYQYNILVNCDIGSAYGRKFIVTPTAENVGTHELTVKISDDFGNVLAEQSVLLNVVNKATSPAENINVLCVGDSLTASGEWVDELYRRLTKTTDKTQHNVTAPVGDGLTNISFVGKKTTANGAGYEGNGGWKYDSYIDPEKAGNPFAYNGVVDFNAYCTDLGIDCIDLCYILLGWNMASYDEDLFKTKAKAFIDLLIAHNPNIKIVLVGVQMPFLDGLGYNYGTVTQNGVYGDYRALQEFVCNLDDWNNDIAGEYADNITTINISGQFDTEYGTWTREVVVNARSAIKLTEQYNGIHPREEGSYQIADAVYRKFTADN